RFAKGKLTENTFRDEPWFKLLAGKDAPSLICIGSPRANHAAEILFAAMYGVSPFKSGHNEALPFRFYWKDEAKPSSFTLKQQEVVMQNKRGVCSANPWSALFIRRDQGTTDCMEVRYSEESTHWE